MTALELDPLFLKALKLLHSRREDSATQLKAMLDDVIAQRRGHKTPSSESEKSSKSKSEEDGGSRKREAEKRSFEKLSQKDLDHLQESKKARRESPAPTEKESSKSSSDRDKDKEREKEKQRKDKEAKEKDRRNQERKEREKEKAEKERQEKEKEKEISKAVIIDESSEEDKSMDADDFAFDLGISCVVCRQFDVSSGNQLVECQECHSLYHQECHRPPVTEQDVNDPRFVWYCSRCSKSLKKMQVSKSSKPKASSSGSAVSKESTPSFSKTETSLSSVLPFRRVDAKISSSKDTSSSKSVSSKESSSSKPLSGLASLAANLSGKTEAVKPKTDSSKKVDKFGSGKYDASKQKSDHSEKSSSKSSKSISSLPSASSSSSSSSKQSNNSAPSTAAASADKRLQMMKKKAAAKLHDKKVHVK